MGFLDAKCTSDCCTFCNLFVYSLVELDDPHLLMMVAHICLVRQKEGVQGRREWREVEERDDPHLLMMMIPTSGVSLLMRIRECCNVASFWECNIETIYSRIQYNGL